ncbi:hypothetical protein FJT64_021515 [Amphibalanus amphitrite]|uniref:Uncharacterized protein n=1 Tax=Amphibalanus amphitrite TaxID=1232801 RepID=A0A6A4WTZ3_AMPAM|nr:hypothetical protein FJT64_021515 [Amphibalanus amphitrite]
MPALYSPTYAARCAPLVTFNPVFSPSPVEMAGPDRLYPGRRGYLPDADSDVSTVTFERELLQRSGSFDALSADDTDLEVAVSQLRLHRAGRGSDRRHEEAAQLRERARPFSYLEPLGATEYPRRERHEHRSGRHERLDWPVLRTHGRRLDAEYPKYAAYDGEEQRERWQRRQQRHEYRDWQELLERQERPRRHGRRELRESEPPARPAHAGRDSDTSAYDIPPRVLRPTKPLTASGWREEAPPPENIYETPRQAEPSPPTRRSPSPVYADVQQRRAGVRASGEARSAAPGVRAPPERGRPTEPPPPPPQQEQESEYLTILAHSETSAEEAPAAICQESETSSGEEEGREDTTDGTPGREALRDGSELWAGNEVRRLPPERRCRAAETASGERPRRDGERHRRDGERPRRDGSETRGEREARSGRRALLGARSRLLSSLRAGRSRSAGPVPASSRTRQASPQFLTDL